ncbi:alpha-ketoacid dehydrogenase subunit alpha/beta [Actinotalea lenta]|uniref:alpha-ketoacid dehydrogenase subunit alpha/beta n=1 Tax=Actinotalea lenta TaxID=3064654 RepID=UPI002729E059|nr:alpha-ketoacid dehydrogenase subunit alpha/beta [Isoptericola sp. b490]
MPRALTVDPRTTRLPGAVTSPELPVHRYDRPLADERARLGDERLVAMLRDMMLIRETETMISKLKSVGQYRSLEFQYKGPAHLSGGQEAAAVGVMGALTVNDHTFGSHRSHGEFLAKGMSAIRLLDHDRLAAVVEGFDHGGVARALDKAGIEGGLRSRAEHFLVTGFLAELFGRSNGFNRGMGGSMHAFFTEFGIYPNNAIVGGSAGIATGSALYRKLHAGDGIAVSNTGDGSTGCGPVWEAMGFASMGQFTTLWDDAHRGRLPVAFVFHNNFYAMGGQTIGETTGWERLSRIALGVNPEAMHAETVDGTDPLAVLDAMTRKRELLLRGDGPVLLDVECYRGGGHSPSDGNAYRTKEEMALWAAVDPIEGFAARLVDEDVVAAAEVDGIREAVADLVLASAHIAADPDVSAPQDVRTDHLLVGRMMFSGRSRELPPAPHGDVLTLPDEVARVRQLAKRSRTGVGEDGQTLSARQAVSVRDALFEAILAHALHDEKLVIYGEECREWGGAFGVYRGLSDLLPYHRLFNSPISEAAVVATAVGYAMEGGRALVELMYADFIGRAGDELFNQLGKWQAMSGGRLSLPVVVRTSVGSKYGAQHSQDWTSLIAHIPGIQVLYPATPYDAKGLLASALASEDPTVFFESQRLYETVETFRPEGVPSEYYRIPIGRPSLKRRGSDLTLLTIGPSLYPARAAATILSTKHGLEAEIIDARSLVPFDYEPVLESVRHTHRIALVSEASERGSLAMTMAQVIADEAADHLAAPVQVLGSPNWIVPSGDLEATYFPQAGDIIDLVHDKFRPLAADHTPTGPRRQSRAALAARGL